MAALDFPASPTNGQVYGNWVYSTSKGAWQAKPMVSAKTVTSDVAPGSPADGDEWLNTIDGCLYIYYTDVDGSQWVQVKNDASFSSTLGPRVDTLELPGRVIQTVQVAYGTQSTNSTSTMADTGLSATITPRYSNSSIVILLEQNGLTKTGNSGTGLSLNLLRGGTTISAVAYAKGYGLPDTSYMGGVGTTWLDNPGTTSPVTYKTQFSSFNGSGNVYTQTGAASTIILMEIKV